MKKVVNVCNVWKDPNDADTETGAGSSAGINAGQAGSSKALAEIWKESREDKELWSEATFPPQQSREFYFAMNNLLDSMNKLGTAGGGQNEQKNEEKSDVVQFSAAGLFDRRCIQCDGLITRLTADFCDACLESND